MVFIFINCNYPTACLKTSLLSHLTCLNKVDWIELNWIDVISSRQSSHFWVQRFSIIKAKLLHEMIQSAYLCVLFYMSSTKGYHLSHLTNCWKSPRWGTRWRPLLVMSQASSRAPPTNHTSSCWEDQRLSTKGKIVLKYCNIKNSGEGFHQPHLVQLWGYEFKLCTSG